MPIHLGKDSKGNFAQWGHRTKYYYIAGNELSLKKARTKAQKQASAIFASGYIGESILPKLNNLFNSIINENINDTIEDDELEEILNFRFTDKGEQIEDQVSRAENFVLGKFKEKFKDEFNDATIEFTCEKYNGNDVFAEIDEFKHNQINFNLFPIYKAILKDNKNLDDILDLLEYDNPVIGHELAHIADIRKNGLNEQDVHGETFKKEFKRINGSNFISFECKSKFDKIYKNILNESKNIVKTFLIKFHQ